ncbi:MAG TPA: hypothetical protein VIL01_10575 [Thermomicrobiales bacterium]
MPTLTLLDDAMLRPGRMVPAVNRLGGGTIAMAGTSQPWRIVGTDAVVYQLRQASGRVLALRCFLADSLDPTLAERYRGLTGDALRRLRKAPHSPIVPHLTYVADGLTFPAADFRSIHLPVVAMEWVMGPTLLSAVDRACRSGDRAFIGALAAAWLSMMETLSGAGFVHGNLTGDNALVRPGEGIALVDYDTATWPGSPPPPRSEGTPGYRHPAGGLLPADRRDDFAALVIYTSLRILAVWPDLRESHGDPPSKLGGVILFSVKDLLQPESSPLLAKLRALDDPEVQALIGILREACLVRPEEVPPFLEAVAAAVHVARSVQQSRGTGPLDPRERQQRLTRLNSLLLSGDEEAARQYWRSSGLHDDPEVVREFGARMAEIERRARRKAQRATDPLTREDTASSWERSWPKQEASTKSRSERLPADAEAPWLEGAIERLRSALESGDVATVGELWPRVKGHPAAAPYAIQAMEVIAKLMNAAIAGAIERGDDEATIAAVREAEEMGVAVGTAARKAARAASRRLAIRRALATALETRDEERLAELAISGDLEALEPLPPETIRAVVRALRRPFLQRALASDDDRAILEAYDEEAFSDPDALSAAERARIELAGQRLAWVEEVRTALRKRDMAAIERLIAAIPEGADLRLTRVERERIARMAAQSQAVARLQAAMQSGDDVTIVDALNELEAAGATLPEQLDWQAVRGVIDRLSLTAAIRRAAALDPPDYARLARLLPAAREAYGGQVPYLGANLDFETLEREVRRAAHRARVREAIATGDEVAIAAAALPDPYDALATLTPPEREVVERAIAHQRQMDPLKRAARAAKEDR